MKRALLVLLVSSPIWGFLLLGLIFDTADFLAGVGVVAVLVGSIAGTIYLLTGGGDS